MNIIEVKNNLVKLTYDEDIRLSSFIKITDLKNSYIAQILHLESSRIGKTAIARLIFNFKCGIQAYDGSIPSIQAEIELLSDDFFINILDKTDPLLIGKLAQKDTNVIVSANLLKDKPVICAEKSYQYTQLLENIIKQNELYARKTVVIDITGEVKGNKITASEDFKLPLNQYSIDYIFDRGFDDLTPENKAFIQDVFSELNDYIKTVEYIPFNDFNAVIDYEFKRTNQLQLMILKNRLTQFEKAGIFAQETKEFRILDEKLNSDNTLIIDLSKLNDSLQTEYITYIYEQMEKQNTNFYSVISLNNTNSTKGTLNSIFGAKNVFSSIVCPYSYKYISELKQCSKNMFMFTPVKQQSDFGAYNIFLNKLAEDEFILYGKATKFTPLIIKLEEVNENDFNLIPDYQPEAGVNDGVNDVAVVNEPISDYQIEVNEEVPVMEMPEHQPEEEPEPVMEEPVEEPEEEPEPSEPKVDEDLEDMAALVQQQLSDMSIDIPDDEIADAVRVNNEVVVNESEPISDYQIEANEVPVMEIPEPQPIAEQPEEDSELTDEDLDLIEEIEGVNETGLNSDYQTGVNEEIEEEPVMEEPQPSVTEQILQEEEEKKAQEEAEKTDPIEEIIEKPQTPKDEKLETRTSQTPIVPVYSAEIPDEDIVESDDIQQGDVIMHAEFGRGVVEKIINYGARNLCSVNFDKVGRRLLDPKISEMKKI